MELLYLSVALFSTAIGALSGLGGGVIIKPVLDAASPFDVATISILSSCTVLSMAMVSTVRQHLAGVSFEGRKSLWLVAGSILGGTSGKFLFSLTVGALDNPSLVTAIQSAVLALLLVFVLLYLMGKNSRSLHIRNNLIVVISGFLLGLIASFLGIGGGPFNVVLLTLLFSMDSRSAAAHSILIILFSQSAKLITLLADGGFAGYDLTALFYMIPGGVAGGFLGVWLNRRLKSSSIQILFRTVVFLLILLNLYNLVSVVF